jgi:hypothetical protein
VAGVIAATGEQIARKGRQNYTRLIAFFFDYRDHIIHQVSENFRGGCYDFATKMVLTVAEKGE